jgi:hypothetical protein
MAAKNLPKVFFDVAVNGQPSGRMTFKVRINSRYSVYILTSLDSSLLTLYLRLPRTFVLSVQAKKAWV